MTAFAKARALSVLSTVPASQPRHSEYRLGNVELLGARVHYHQDEEIFGEGEETRNVYRVFSGAVRLYRVLTDGRRQIDTFCLPGDVFGLEFFDRRRISAEAVSDCELIVTSRSLVMQQMEHNCAFGRLLCERANIELAKAQDHAMLLGRKNATERVAAFLLDMSERQGGREVHLPMSRQDIADYLGLTIETVSRTLAELDRRSVLDVAARRIVLRDPAALRLLDS